MKESLDKKRRNSDEGKDAKKQKHESDADNTDEEKVIICTNCYEWSYEAIYCDKCEGLICGQCTNFDMGKEIHLCDTCFDD